MARAVLSSWPEGEFPAQQFCDESERLRVIASYGLHTLRDDLELQEVVRFAARLCEAPIALVSLVEEDQQRFLAREGLDAESTPRSSSFCSHAMLGNEAMIIPDARMDPQFADNPLVTGPPHIRFYAGMPLISSEGAPMGALCVIDQKARPFGLSSLQQEGLRLLARSVMQRFEVHRSELVADDTYKDTQFGFRTILESLPEITWSANPKGEITYINQRWTDYTGLPAADHDSDHIRSAYHPDEVEPWKVDWLAAIRRGEPYEGEYRLRREDGSFGWILARALPLKNRKGEIKSWFGQLIDIDAHHRLSEERDAIAREHKRNAKYLQTMLDSVPAIAWSSGPDGEFPIFNARFTEVTGEAPPEETLEWQHVVHPDDFDNVLESYYEARETGTDFEAEIRLRQADGSYRWVLSRAVSTNPGSDQARWFGTLVDVHENHCLAEERELLTRELAHRIRNIFSVIGGLVSLRARGNPQLKQFAEQLVGTVHALGRAQEFVGPVQGDGNRELADLLYTLMSPYEHERGARIRVSGDAVNVGPKATTPLTLIFHELATNAVKYGALSNRGGSIGVTLENSADAITVNWHEKGGPEIDGEPGEHGFGTRLIGSVIRSQLRGSLELDWHREGLHVAITLPHESLRL